MCIEWLDPQWDGMIDWAEKFAGELMRLTQGRAAYNDMLDWALELWRAKGECDPVMIARDEFRDAIQDE